MARLPVREAKRNQRPENIVRVSTCFEEVPTTPSRRQDAVLMLLPFKIPKGSDDKVSAMSQAFGREVGMQWSSSIHSRSCMSCIAVAPLAMKTAERTPKMVYNESLPGVSRKIAAKPNSAIPG
jgi:hypothetical protein